MSPAALSIVVQRIGGLIVPSPSIKGLADAWGLEGEASGEPR